jgi:kynurenine formamidase
VKALNSARIFALDASAAEYLVRHGVRLVGIDYLSIAPYDEPSPKHILLLQAKSGDPRKYRS